MGIITSFRGIINEASKGPIKFKSGESISIEDFLNSFKKGDFDNISKTEMGNVISKEIGMTVTKDDFMAIYNRGLIEKGSGRGAWNILGTKKSSKSSPKTEEPEASPEDEEIFNAKIGSGSSTKLDSMEKSKLTKYKIPTATNGDKFAKFAKDVLLSMINHSNKTEKGSLLLTGDPGTGKTSSIEQFAGLVGMKIITVEAPHTSEEHIISIPYLVRTGTDTESKTFEATDTGSSFEVVNAESSLISDLKNKTPMKESEWNKFISSNKHLEPIRDKFRKPIDTVRNTYNTILFLDEFYRITSTRMGNLFRTILNGSLGDTEIPKNVYIIFASNMDNTDGSLADIPLNHQFSRLNFDIPSKEDFLNYMASKYTSADLGSGVATDEKENDIKPSVYNLFAENMTDDDLGVKDSTDIRISPRRWEEIIKYVNANIPPKNQKMAQALIHYIYTNMRNYETNDLFDNVEKYVDLIKKLIKEESGFDVSKTTKPKPSEWEDMFYNQIDSKLRMGKDRKYTLSLAGLPGVGKTSIIKGLTDKFGVRVILIDASTLNADDVIGLTIPTGKGKKLKTKFSEPPLYAKIMAQYDPKLVVKGMSYTHILFLDEITRTTKPVMNAIRSLLLEKRINANYELPENIMIVSAMNPKDVGAEALSDHLKDVLDVIDVEMKIENLYSYLKEREENINSNTKLGFNLTNIVIELVRQIIETVGSKTNVEGEKISGNSTNFFWGFNNNVMYVSPRELDDIVSGSVGHCSSYLTEFMGYSPANKYSLKEYDDFIDSMQGLIFEKFEAILKFAAVDKQKITLEDYEGLSAMIRAEIGRSAPKFDELKMVKSTTVNSIFQLFTEAGSSFEALLEYDQTDELIIDYINTVEPEEFNLSLIKIANEIIGDHSGNKNSKFLEMSTEFYTLLKRVDWSKINNRYSAFASETITRFLFKKYAVDAYEIVKKDPSANYANLINKMYNKSEFDHLVQAYRTQDNIFIANKE